MRYRSLIAVAALTVLCGCGAGWHRIPLAPQQLPARQQAQIFQAGHATRVHAVAITADSISAVPFVRSPACDSCRIRLATASVDSVRIGNPVAGFWKSVGLVLGSLLGVMILFTVPMP